MASSAAVIAHRARYDNADVTLDIRGPRGGLTATRARELAAAVLDGARTDYRRVVLSTWALSVESAVVLADAIRALPDLESAILADIIAGRPEAEGLAVYRALGDALAGVRLREIDLSDNAVGPKGVDACRAFLSNQPALERLIFSNCGISAEAARSIADLVLFRTPTELRVLHFFNNMSGIGGAVAIADMVRASPRLADFRFSSSRGGNDGGVALARALRHAAATLVRLDLNDNTFGAPGGAALGATLRACAALRELNVGDTAVGDAGMRAIASGVVRGSAHSLEVLVVSANELTAAGARAVARMARRCTRLRVLDAGENGFGDEGAAYLARALARRAGFRKLAGGDGAAAADPLAELRLGETEMTRRGCVAVAAAAGAHAPRLARLDVSGHDLSARGAESVRAAHARAGGAAGVVDVGDADGDDDEDEDVGDDEAGSGGAFRGADGLPERRWPVRTAVVRPKRAAGGRCTC